MGQVMHQTLTRSLYPSSMRFAYCINDDPSQPDKESGYIEAESIAEAFEKLGPGANVYLLPQEGKSAGVLPFRRPG